MTLVTGKEAAGPFLEMFLAARLIMSPERGNFSRSHQTLIEDLAKIPPSQTTCDPVI
jgi:hypothetical protein